MTTTSSNWAVLLEEQAEKIGDEPFLHVLYQDRYINYRKMNENANRIAHYLLGLKGGPGVGVGTLMGNSPQFLDLFFGIQKIGMYITPVNTELKGDGLAFTIENSDVEALVIDYDLIDRYRSVEDRLPKIKSVIVNTLEAPQDFVVPGDMVDMKEAYGEDIPTINPAVDFDENSILVILYTSGTTGLPKGVVSRYNKNIVDRVKQFSGILVTPDSVYYTAFPLFHGNALYITVTICLAAGCSVALAKKFSATRFWDDINRSNTTIFNTLGAVIPILMKQPERPNEKTHQVTRVLSGGCPADLWEPFENRFNVEIWEVYGAVDGSGIILNFGTAPKGSIGKPHDTILKVVDDNGSEVPAVQPGELLFKVSPEKKSTVEYYKNPEASAEKTKGEWEHTGDLVYQDQDGHLFFVGRKTDSMRRRGENVSAFEVEKEILKHPGVLECAVYGVPSELTEDEIMACIRPVEGERLDPDEIWDFLQDKLAKFAIPRYIRFVEDFPRTETFRVKKNELKALGVTEDTVDAENKE